MMSTILILGAAQAIFLVILLLSKRRRHLPDYVLALWLSLLAGHLFIYFLYAITGLGQSWLLNLNSSFPFLQGPFLYFYVATLIDTKKRLRITFALHVIPFIAFNTCVFFLSCFSDSSFTHPAGVSNQHLFAVSSLFNWLLLLSVPIYAVWTWVLVGSYGQRTEEYLSDLEAIDLAWLRYLIGALGGVWLAVTIAFLLRDPEAMSSMRLFIFAPVTIFVYIVGYFGLKQSIIFSDYNIELNTGNRTGLKYSKSGLDEKAGKAMHADLIKLMDSDKPYLDSELTLPELAKKLGISPNYLSQILNDIGGESYYDFINEYRVREFQENLNRKEFQHYTLLAVAMQSGFASKPSFNRAVKKITGKTPSQFVSTSTD